jgi:hypothetical protein
MGSGECLKRAVASAQFLWRKNERDSHNILPRAMQLRSCSGLERATGSGEQGKTKDEGRPE